MSGLNHPGEPEPDPILIPDAAIDQSRVTRARKAVPIFVRLTLDDGRPSHTEKGFAVAWTDRQVLVQVLWTMYYYRGARESGCTRVRSSGA
jgi:hypothetical protein